MKLALHSNRIKSSKIEAQKIFINWIFSYDAINYIGMCWVGIPILFQLTGIMCWYVVVSPLYLL